MSELTLNHSRTSLRGKHQTWEWYTMPTAALNLHVHDKSILGKWSYEFVLANKKYSLGGFPTKEMAFEAGKAKARIVLERAIKQME